MGTIGQRSRYAFVLSPQTAESGLREVDIYAAGRWLTCDDDHAFVPQFARSIHMTFRYLLITGGSQLTQPFPELSVADNHRQLLSEDSDLRERHRFMDWGPTTNNFNASLFVTEGTARIAFSFHRPAHHDSSELGQVFVAELPFQELLVILHDAAWALTSGDNC